jgi:hypothetical protein
MMFREDPAFMSVLEPGDRILATMRAAERFRVVLATLVSAVLAVAWFLAVLFSRENFAVAVPVFVVAMAVDLALWSRQQRYFFAVTERLFICHGVTWLRGKPTRLRFSAPLPAVSLRVGGRNSVLGTSVSYQGPGAGPQGLNLTVSSRSEEFLQLVVTALRAGGASVEP